MPIPGPDDIVVKNHALAINPIDNGQQATGMLVKGEYPVVIGSDVAGVVHENGSNVTKFKIGDRVVGHGWGLVTGKPQDSAFSLYTNLPAKNAAIVPSSVHFKDAAVLPMAVDTATCGLFQPSPMFALPWPSLKPASTGKVIVVYGASSSIGSMATQLAAAAGARVIAIASPRNHDFCRTCGAKDVFDYKSSTLVDDVVRAVGNDTFVGIYDCISTAETFAHDLPILEKLGGGNMACSHQPPKDLPENVKAKFVFGLGEFSFPVWENFITPALESGQLKCLPEPLVIGKGLESVQAALDRAKAGVSAQKVVVEL